LNGVKLKVEYISILAQAQKLVGVASLDRFMLSTGQLLAAGYTDVRHKVDTNQVVDDYGEYLGVDPRVIRTNEEANALITAERQAAADQAQADQAAKLAAAARDASEAPLSGDSALNRIVEGAARSSAQPAPV
jgi:hypothetical protein